MRFHPKMLVPVLAIAAIVVLSARYARPTKTQNTYRDPPPPPRHRDRQSTLNRPPREQVWPDPRESREPRGPGTGFYTSPRNFFEGGATGGTIWTTNDGTDEADGASAGAGQGEGFRQQQAITAAAVAAPVQHTQMGVTGTEGTGGFLG